jgi:hypothetical protein
MAAPHGAGRRFLPKIRIEVAVAADATDRVVEAIGAAAKTGQICDGKIFVAPIAGMLRPRQALRPRYYDPPSRYCGHGLRILAQCRRNLLHQAHTAPPRARPPAQLRGRSPPNAERQNRTGSVSARCRFGVAGFRQVDRPTRTRHRSEFFARIAREITFLSRTLLAQHM